MHKTHHTFQAVVPRQGDFPPLRNPWVEKHPDSSSSSASRSGRSRRLQHLGGPPPASEWLRPPVRHQLHGPSLQIPLQGVSVPSTQGSSPGVSASGGLEGGDSSCDTFCYHFLQVVYIAGILIGISLTIVGSVLRGNPRRSDLVVLVYIGVLLTAVCTLLLSVHYCVRRNVKERRRALRLARTRPSMPAAVEPLVSIPLQQLPVQPEAVPMECYHSHSMPRTASSRSRSQHSHGRRYYLTDVPDRPVEEWERHPYQPLIHRPR